MSGVLLRKQCRRRGVGLPLDASGHPYRSAHHMGRDALSSALDISTKWIVGWAITMPLELQTLLITYSFVIQHMPNLDDVVGVVKDLPIRVRIENFTTSCTDEAMNSEDSECEVCGFSFGHTHSVEEATEPAVKTSCSHIIGALCLQTWVEFGGGRNTCPKYRNELFQLNEIVPPLITHIDRSWENPTRIESALDNRVVAIFLEPSKDLYGDYMRILFVRLHRMEQQIRTLNLLCQVAMPAGEPEDH
jgi:hypothetical protein